MRTLIFCILLCTPALAQKPEPAELTGARKAHETEVAKAKAAYDDAVKELNRKYANKLKELQEERTKKGDLDGALAVRKEGERVGVDAKNPIQHNLDGLWSVNFSNTETPRIYSIKGSEISFLSTKGKPVPGKILIVQGKLIADFQNERPEEWSLAQNGNVLVKMYVGTDLSKHALFGVGIKQGK